MFYDLRIYKSWKGRNLAAAWVNTYILSTEVEIGDTANVDAIINAFMAMEHELHLSDVNFLHATFSTVRNEPVYDPKTLYVAAVTGTGNRGYLENEAPLDLNIALKVKKECAFGRSGTAFYRGALTNFDVITNSRGESELDITRSPLNNPALWSNAFGHVNNLESATWVMKVPAMDDPNSTAPVEARIVKGIGLGGISVNKRNHKYFDEIPKAARAAIREARRTGGSVTFDNLGQAIVTPATPAP